ELTQLPFVPRHHRQAPDLQLVERLLALDTPAAQAEKAQLALDPQRRAGHQALALHPPRIGPRRLADLARHEHTKLKGELILDRVRAVRIERVALEQHRIGDGARPIEAHDLTSAVPRKRARKPSIAARTSSPPSKPRQRLRTIPTSS